MKKIALLIFVLTPILFACNKDKAGINKASANVQIRVVNKTALPLTNMVVSTENFGTVAPFQTTVYHSFSNLTSYVPPKLVFYNNSTEVEYLIGLCGTPPLPEPAYLKGTFTYTITSSNTSPQGFEFSFTQDYFILSFIKASSFA